MTATLRDVFDPLNGARLTVAMEGAGASDGRIRVLLADDDEPFVEALRPLIDGQPSLTVVGAAHDGLAAIELAERVEPDAVVIDLHMPLLDGVSAVARLRGEYPVLCLIALTGDSDPALHEAVLDAGADAVLLKHEFVDTLLAQLASVRATR
jgi:DNA-binding NarL/FixJ family response regulator